ncbi:MAG: hypothetical protein EZS28_002416 [Streblomastix strix]|uniref:Uncharacterized protein n=1 Tax=Streblomastix strix TaxID=222440 RepID=A0A5J4X489_9EUKA|nr:MAG: hypothetical protein EZS28_002416 [Streblomastix strix]
MSYTLRYIGLKANGEHHKGFGEDLLNVRIFSQRHARHEHLTISDWKAFWREVDTDLYLDSVRMDLDEDDNHLHDNDHDHDHDHNRRHDKERNDTNDQLDLGRGRKRRRVISSQDSGYEQNNEDSAYSLHCEVERQQLRQFRAFRNKREQDLLLIQTVTGAPVYMLKQRFLDKSRINQSGEKYTNRELPNIPTITRIIGEL